MGQGQDNVRGERDEHGERSQVSFH
jgi:hypothetical protein